MSFVLQVCYIRCDVGKEKRTKDFTETKEAKDKQRLAMNE